MFLKLEMVFFAPLSRCRVCSQEVFPKLGFVKLKVFVTCLVRKKWSACGPVHYSDVPV